MEAAAENAPAARDGFVEEVAGALVGSVEEVLRESEQAMG